MKAKVNLQDIFKCKHYIYAIRNQFGMIPIKDLKASYTA